MQFWPLVCNSLTTVKNGSTVLQIKDDIPFNSLSSLCFVIVTSMLWTWYSLFVKNLLEESIIKRVCLCSGTSSPQLWDLGTAFEACRRKDILVTSQNLFRNFLRFSRSFCYFYTIPAPFASFQHLLHHFWHFRAIFSCLASFLHHLSRSFCTFLAIFQKISR